MSVSAQSAQSAQSTQSTQSTASPKAHRREKAAAPASPRFAKAKTLASQSSPRAGGGGGSRPTTPRAKGAGKGSASRRHVRLEALLLAQETERGELRRRFASEHAELHTSLLAAMCREAASRRVASQSASPLARLCMRVNAHWRPPLRVDALSASQRQALMRDMLPRLLGVRDATLTRQGMQAALLQARQEKDLRALGCGAEAAAASEHPLCPFVEVRFPRKYGAAAAA